MNPLTGQQNLETPESASSEGPAMWVIADEDTKIYLFGFAPLLKSGTEWESEAITAALEESNLMVVESDGTAPEAQAAVQSLIPKIGFNKNRQTLSKLLTADQRAKLEAALRPMKIPLSALDSLKPWLASVQLEVLSVSQGGYDLENPPSASLIKRAKAAGIEVSALEEPTALMNLLAKFSKKEQIGLLMHTAKTVSDHPDQPVQLSKAWLDGDVEEIGELLHGSNGAWSSQKVYDAMLIQRNTTWVTEIERLLNEHEGTVFFAVGLGHLAGKDSLVRMLQDKEWTVNRK